MSAPRITGAELLQMPMPEWGTLTDFLLNLLSTLWAQGESFSGKRPFGDSGWQFEVYEALVRAGHLPGTLDEDGFLEEFSANSMKAADELVERAIWALRGAK